MKKILSLLLIFPLLFSLFSCAEEEKAPREAVGGVRTESGEVYPTDLLFFDGKAVEFDEFRYYYLNYKNMYLEEDPSYFEKEGNEEKLKKEILTILLDNSAVREVAKENGITLTKSDKKAVQEEISKTIDYYQGETAFEDSLKASFMTMDLYTYVMEYSSLYLKLFNALFEDGKKYAWDDETFYDYYKEHYVAVQEIFLPYESGENKDKHPLTLEKAKEIYDKAMGGEDFWGLVEKYGKDENMLSSPDGYYFTEGQAEDTLYQASAALKIDGISEPVPGESGLYIIKRMDYKKHQMDKNKETALFGYTDSFGKWHSGAYDEEFISIYKKRAEKIEISYGPLWEKISTKTVF